MSETKKEANWSELCPDVLEYVFEQLSFSDLNRGESVCSSCHSISRHCVLRQNQISWLILFPRNNDNNNNNVVCYLFRTIEIDFTKPKIMVLAFLSFLR
ncbi:unnamed protein product [Arabidopsis halleri]